MSPSAYYTPVEWEAKEFLSKSVFILSPLTSSSLIHKTQHRIPMDGYIDIHYCDSRGF